MAGLNTLDGMIGICGNVFLSLDALNEMISAVTRHPSKVPLMKLIACGIPQRDDKDAFSVSLLEIL
jgi:hypothetical protein